MKPEIIRNGFSKNVTLINPPWHSEYPSLPGDQGLSQTIGLGYLGAVLETAGHKVKIIDALSEGINCTVPLVVRGRKIYRKGLSYKDIIERIDAKTDLIGITVPFTTMATIARELSLEIKRYFPGIPVIAGGVYPSTLPEKALFEGIDYAVVGEGEIPLTEFAADVPPEEIKGLFFKKNGQLIGSGRSEIVTDLDSLPFPARHLLPMEDYVKWSPRGKTNKRTASIVTSRGCPFDCNFCSVHAMIGYKWRGRSPENVLSEIKQLIHEYGVEHIEFEDDNLTLNPERAEKIFEGLSEMDGNITWSTPNGVRLDTLTYSLLKKMKDSGCSLLTLAVESGDPTILKAMNKRLSLERVEEVVGWCNEIGIPTFAFFMLGYPGETRESFEKTLAFAEKLKKMGLERYGVAITKAYPGTKLGKICQEKGWLVDKNLDSTLILGDYVSIITDDFDEKEIKRRLNVFRSRLSTQEYLEKKVAENIFLRWLNKTIPEPVQNLLRRPIRSLLKRL